MPSFEPMKPLPLESLRRRCLPSVFAFATTAELDAQAGFVGQHRAQTSLAFGAGIRRDGYNRFVMGPTGSGKHAMAGQYRRARAAAEARPDDWVYVNNFKHPHKPFAIAPAAAVARLVEHGSRMTGDSRKLTGNIQALADLLTEADHCARGGGVPCVSSTEVRHAIDAQLQRADRVRDRMHESILRGTVMIDAACAWL